MQSIPYQLVAILVHFWCNCQNKSFLQHVYRDLLINPTKQQMWIWVLDVREVSGQWMYSVTCFYGTYSYQFVCTRCYTVIHSVPETIAIWND